MKTEAKKFEPSTAWASLGDEFHDLVSAAEFPKAILRYRHQKAAEEIGLGHLSEPQWEQHFHQFAPLEGSFQKPLALRYHGHQFLHYNPELGDGRGFLFAQMRDSKGRLLDFGTKGSGQTPWSRRGDGRLTLKGAVRELLATSFLEAHGVNTSRTFSIFETGEALQRGDEPSPTRSAVLVRLSHGHVRIGMFQRWAHLNKKEEMQKLLDYCIQYHYPYLQTVENKPSAFFEAVCANVAKTTAQWMALGFVHGVLNTDNINITGESFDYGPYRFLPHYDDKFTAAYFDHNGLYAYGQQPRVLLWNLEQLERSLNLLEPNKDLFDKGYERFQTVFNSITFPLFAHRLGVESNDVEKLERLTLAAIDFLRASKAPFEHFFFDWFGGLQRKEKAMNSINKHFYIGPQFEAFLLALEGFAPSATANSDYFQRTEPVHLYIEKIEELWKHIDDNDNWEPLYSHIEDMEQIPSTLSL
jgi:serine/tyrosine/threonine adenylyltransferase